MHLYVFRGMLSKFESSLHSIFMDVFSSFSDTVSSNHMQKERIH